MAHPPGTLPIMLKRGRISIGAQRMAHAPWPIGPLTLDRIVLAIDADELLPIDDMDAFARWLTAGGQFNVPLIGLQVRRPQAGLPIGQFDRYQLPEET
ncbi:hypothetical protein D9M73_237340 [compost metagenome]